MKVKRFEQVLLVIICLVASFKVTADNNAPYLYILGVAQDAGYPQTGCYEIHCMPGWEDNDLRRACVRNAANDPLPGRKWTLEPVGVLQEY